MKSAPLASIAPFVAGFQEILQRIERISGFVLLPVEVPGPDVARALGDFLTESERPAIVVEPRDDEALWRDLVATLTAATPEHTYTAAGYDSRRPVVLLVGAETLPDSVHAGLRLLNQRRETLSRHLQCPLLWCGPPSFLDLAWEEAPDFWSIRAIDARLVEEPAVSTKETPAFAPPPALPSPALDEVSRLRGLLEAARKQGDRRAFATFTVQLSNLLLADGKVEEAERVVADAVAESRKTQGVAGTLEELLLQQAIVERRRGRAVAAAATLGALLARPGLGAPVRLKATLEMAAALDETGDVERGEAGYREALALARAGEDLEGEARALLGAYGIAARTGRAVEAAEPLARALSIAERLGDLGLQSSARAAQALAARGGFDTQTSDDLLTAAKGLRSEAEREQKATAPADERSQALPAVVDPEGQDSTPRTPNNLRARNPYFRGRGEELADLEAVLGSGGKATITHASVFGLGGVGKTALALELAHRAVERGAYPGGVWWVAAEGRPVDALVAFAPVLRANAPEEVRAMLPWEETRAEVIAEVVRYALQGQRSASLLVLDNVSEPWGRYVPGGAVQVLVTTRDANLAIGKVRKLEVLSKEQAREVAEAIAGETRDKPEVEARDRVVVTELGGLAVAVEMAARATKKWFRGSWTVYERVLGAEMEKVLQDWKLYGDYGRGVFAAIDLSIDKCDDEARSLLEGAAVLAPEAVPREWALGAARIEAGGFTEARATAALRELGLITVDEDKWVVSMHRLVHRRVRARAEAEHNDVWEGVIARGVECVATWLTGAVELDQTRAEMEAVDARREHIDQALHIAENAGSEVEWIKIATKLATHLHNRASYDESLELFQRTLAKAENLTPPDPSWVAVVLSNLAMVHLDLGQPASARPLLERALAIDEATHGPDHTMVAILLSNLATVHYALGQPDIARPLLERALAIDEATRGPDHPTVAQRLSKLALVHKDLGQPAAARPLLERALAIAEAAYGPDHPQVAINLSNLAGGHRALGQPAAARPLLERALAIDEATYGPDHPRVASDLSNLAAVRLALGQPAAARPLLERAIAIAEARLPPDHPALALYRKNLAVLDPPP